MANSKITITFTGVLFENDSISFEYFNNSTNQVVSNLIETWKITRRASYEIPLVDTGLQYPDISSRFIAYFNLDYNGLNIFTVNYINSSVVEIVSNSEIFKFQNLTITGNIEAIIQNNTSSLPFEVVSSSIDTFESIPCESFEVNISTSTNIVTYTLDRLTTPLNSTTLSIPYPRGSEFKIILTDAQGKQINFPTQTNADINKAGPFNDYLFVEKLLSSNITIQTNTLINGTTVNIYVSNANSLNKQYSLDGLNWSTSSIFTGQSEGDYTLYVKDQYGCQVTKDFTISGVSKLKPYFSISKANAFNFIKIEEPNGENIFENQNNTFNGGCVSSLNYTIPQPFNKKDKPVLQIKTNYQELSLFLRTESGSESELGLQKLTSNLDRFLALDSIIYKHASGNLAMYFNSGNKYDELGSVIGEYSLYGNLPDFAKKGNFVTVGQLGTFEISTVTIDSEENKKIILFNTPYIGEKTTVKATSIYNLLNYEVYEYYFNFNFLNEGMYDLIVKATPLNEAEEIYLSETFDLRNNHLNTLHIEYYNKTSNNRSIFYKFGIKNVLRVLVSETESYFLEENEINVNDDNVQSIKSFLNKGNKYLFEDLTTNQMETLAIALSSESVIINGVITVKDDNLNIEQIKNTNLYSIEVKMLVAAQSFDIEDTGYSGQDELDENIFIPNIITDGNNFIKS